MEPTLFGFSKAEWDMVNGFAAWFAAVGSIMTAIVALYLAIRTPKPSAKVEVRIAIVTGSESAESPEYIVIRIVNTGDSIIRVSQIGWRVGLFKKRYAIEIIYNQLLGSPLPVELSHAQEASWYIDIHDGRWIEQFAKGMLYEHGRAPLWSLRTRVTSSIGHVLEAKPDRAVLDKINNMCKQIAADSPQDISDR